MTVKAEQQAAMLKLLAGERQVMLFSAALFAERGEGRVGMAGEGDVAVDLVGDDEDIVAAADRSQSLELVAAPDTSDRIVRVAEEEHAGARVGGKSLEALEIHRVPPVPLDQRVRRSACGRSLR